MQTKTKQESIPFTSYQKMVIAILALLQFTVILDFMVLSPLSDILMKSMEIKPAQFGAVVSGYAFSAAISGILTAGFADKFDRKKILLFFYIGFLGGTLFCGLAQTYQQLLWARILTGVFGGVIGSISMAIVTDLFKLEQRGRVMGTIQMAFAGSQVLGIPIGLYLATQWDWHAPFLMIVAFSLILGIVVALKLKPVDEHLALQSNKNVFQHLWSTVQNRHYRIAFLATALLSTGGFMLMPFGSAFLVNNVQIMQEQLPLIFMITGIGSIFIMPIIGKLSDRIDKFKIFAFGSLWGILMVIIYTHLGVFPLWGIIGINVLMFMGIMSRMIPATALVSAIPDMKDRGAFMSINASLQQMAGGVAAVFAGLVVVQPSKTSPLEHYDWLGYIVSATMLLCIFLVSRVSKLIKEKHKEAAPVTIEDELVAEQVPVIE
jgi:predicted MFS family arabinose efflux permease